MPIAFLVVFVPASEPQPKFAGKLQLFRDLDLALMGEKPMTFRYLASLAVAVLSLVLAPPRLLAQPPGAYEEGEIHEEPYKENFSERAGVDQDFDPGVDELEYESEVNFPGEPFDYAEREYGELNEYEANYGDYDTYAGDYGYDNLYTADWYRDDSVFDTWYDVE